MTFVGWATAQESNEIGYEKFDFGEAVKRLNEGKTVRRLEWSQHIPVTFLVLVPENQIKEGVLCESYIGSVEIKGSNENIRIRKFNPLQEDMFATDWIEYSFHISRGNINENSIFTLS